jgi:hypothetical protein
MENELKKNTLVIAISNSFNKEIGKLEKFKNWSKVHFLNFSIFESKEGEFFKIEGLMDT